MSSGNVTFNCFSSPFSGANKLFLETRDEHLLSNLDADIFRLAAFKLHTVNLAVIIDHHHIAIFGAGVIGLVGKGALLLGQPLNGFIRLVSA